MKLRHAIIADDLTGAMDAAAAFANRGFAVSVVLESRFLGRMGFQAMSHRIAALCTHSRHDAPATARRKVRRACDRLRAGGYSLLYQKLDSTAQGNIVAEVEAARDAGGFAAALVCPAHPAQGRRVRGAVLHVRGAGTVHLGERFRAQGLLKPGLIGAPVSVAKMARAFEAGHRFLLAHATSERDLGFLVRAVLQSKQRVLLAGSAGMAAVLAKRMAHGLEARVRIGHGLEAHAPSAKNTLIVAGSTNPVTERQLKMLIERTGAVPLRLGRLTGKQAAAALASGRDVVIRVPVHRRSDRDILRQLDTLTPLFRARLAGGLLLTGGDTAALVCRSLRPAAIAISGEIAPGLAWGRFVGGVADGLAVCTKPGGFGRDQSLVRAIRFLARVPAGAPTTIT